MVLNITEIKNKIAVARAPIPEPYGFHASLLDFEQSLAPLQKQLDELLQLQKKYSETAKPNNKAQIRAGYLDAEILELQNKISGELKTIYQQLTPWQKVGVARHAERPRFLDFAKNIFTDFTPLKGDRYYGEDCAIVGGFAFFEQQPIVLIGQERGKDTQTRILHNFGMPKPEAYRKAIRLMQLAHQFSLPVITLIDTPGAYPGKEAEEHGQAEAIARNIDACLSIAVPFISVVIGEGGSGGAIAIATADRVAMLEHAVYSVISPEGCASILWRDSKKAETAATAQKITAQDLLQFGVIDKIIKEPIGGAHRAPYEQFGTTKQAIHDMLVELKNINPKNLIEKRHEKYLAIGQNLA